MRRFFVQQIQDRGRGGDPVLTVVEKVLWKSNCGVGSRGPKTKGWGRAELFLQENEEGLLSHGGRSELAASGSFSRICRRLSGSEAFDAHS